MRTLRQALDEGVDAPVWATALRSVAAELDALHAGGELHGDVAAETVLLPPHGAARLAPPRPHGSSGADDDTLVALHPDRLAAKAPEVLRGAAAGPAADRYALGLLLFECVVGEPPFPTVDVAIAHAQGTRCPRASALRPSLPCEVDAALGAALARDPARRPGSAIALVDAVRDAYAPVAGRRRRFVPSRLFLPADR